MKRKKTVTTHIRFSSFSLTNADGARRLCGGVGDKEENRNFAVTLFFPFTALLSAYLRFYRHLIISYVFFPCQTCSDKALTLFITIFRNFNLK